jgi:hypothetical protein
MAAKILNSDPQNPRRSQQHSAAEIRMDMDRRIKAAEPDEVVEVVDVVRVEVVLGRHREHAEAKRHDHE